MRQNFFDISYSFLLSFIKPRDLHSHTSDEMWRRHTDSAALFHTMQHEPKTTITLRSGLAERELILKENTIIKAFHIIPATQIYRWSLQQRWIKHLQTTRFKHNKRLLIYFYHSNSSCKHLKYCSMYKLNGTLFRFIRKRQTLTAKLGL